MMQNIRKIYMYVKHIKNMKFEKKSHIEYILHFPYK